MQALSWISATRFYTAYLSMKLKKLQSVLNAAARVIACFRMFDHVTNTLKELLWLPVEQRIIFKLNLVCFKVLNNLAPSYLTELLRVYESARRLR